MKFGFKILLLRLLLKVSRRGITKIVGASDKRLLMNSVRRGIGSFSNKDIDRAISDIKKGDFRGYEDVIKLFESADITIELILEWLEKEKFLREHRMANINARKLQRKHRIED